MYREIARNRKPDSAYQPWYAHNQAHLRKRRPKLQRLVADGDLARVVAVKLRPPSVVTGSDQPMATSPLPASHGVARVH